MCPILRWGSSACLFTGIVLASATARSADGSQPPASVPHGLLHYRLNAATRAKLVQEQGGNDASEKAVNLALDWLAAQQLADGGWDFNTPECGGSLKNGRNAATGLALLPLLAAGQTHRDGKHKEAIDKGLAYLITVIKPDGSLMDAGNMYSHGIASICLTEAYAMTGDRQLQGPAQRSLDFIMAAQDKKGGGWRYMPGQAGDTSVFGWQFAALKTGHWGELAITPATMTKAAGFLDSVQSNDGANYGYTSAGQGGATTAVGLLGRLHLGWKQENASLQKGVEFLARLGPSASNLYFNYYATQVLRQYGGEPWRKWNETLRDQLVRTQDSANGPNRGSWRLQGDHGSERGGRLYCTALACLMLESYYRHPAIDRTTP